MRRFIPFVFTTLAVLLTVALVTAYRAGLLAKVTERFEEHVADLEEQVADVAETE